MKSEGKIGVMSCIWLSPWSLVGFFSVETHWKNRCNEAKDLPQDMTLGGVKGEV